MVSSLLFIFLFLCTAGTVAADARLETISDPGSMAGSGGSRPLQVARASDDDRAEKKAKSGPSPADKVWRSQELDLLSVGLACADLDGDGRNEIAIIDPHTVYVYRMTGDKLIPMAEYSAGALELKSLDAAVIRKQGPARLYISAQNRGALSSLVLEFQRNTLIPVVKNVDYFLRVIDYPTQGPMLLGQKKGIRRMFDGPVYRMVDKGDELVAEGRFGVPLKIPVFGFTIGDFTGERRPLIAVYDRNDHLRIYQPDGKRLYVSKSFYGGSDVMLRWHGPERQAGNDARRSEDELEDTFFRPRLRSYDLDGDGVYEILAIGHSSKTMRLLSRTKMLEEGQVIGLTWNGDALDERWGTPKIEGMVTDFAVETLPGLEGKRLITLERKKTDWLAFLRSKSQLRAYDIQFLLKDGVENVRKGSGD